MERFSNSSLSPSRVLLLGATGKFGSRLVPALLSYHHHVVAVVRSPAKLPAKFLPSLFSQLTIVQGDATSSRTITQALRDHFCDAIVNVAGNQVLPWDEPVLEKIVRAVVDAAVEVGKERGEPLRAWFIGGMGSLRYPGTEWLIQDYMPSIATVQHQSTVRVLESVPVCDLRWSCLCVAMMRPAVSGIELLAEPRKHRLILKANEPPGWIDHWVRNVPLVGVYLNLLMAVPQYTTELEDVADFLAEDLKNKSAEWVGGKVGMKQSEKAQ